ncbi:MAG: glutamyl-tRNA reductase, partial [Desulfofundulus sp.]
VRQEFGGDLSGRTVLIIGAGEMGELTLKNLIARGVSTVLVSNRSFDRAETLAREYGGRAVRYDEFYDHLKHADIVIACTSATHFVVSAEKVRSVVGDRRERPLFIIDIAVPRDVEPSVAEIPGVYLYDIDDLERVVSESLEERKKAAVAAEKIVSDAVKDFLKWLNTLTVLPTIKALKDKFNEIKEEELRRCFKRLGCCDQATEQVIRSMANSIVNKLLHNPITRLKEYASRHEGHLYSKVLENLFDLETAGEMKYSESEEIASKQKC